MHITISLGVATFPNDGNGALEIVQRADQSLFRAKTERPQSNLHLYPKVDRPDSFHPTVDASAIIYGPADAQIGSYDRGEPDRSFSY